MARRIERVRTTETAAARFGVDFELLMEEKAELGWVPIEEAEGWG